MPRRRDTAEQIITKLRQAEVEIARGQSVAEVCRELGTSEQTYYRWRKEYGGLRVNHLKRLKSLELENGRLRTTDCFNDPRTLNSLMMSGPTTGGRSAAFDALVAEQKNTSGKNGSQLIDEAIDLLLKRYGKHLISRAESRKRPPRSSSPRCSAQSLGKKIGLYKTEVIRRRGPWRHLEAVEFATLGWVEWFNNRRLLAPIGNVPPTECEQQYYLAQKAPVMTAGVNE